MTTEQIEAAVVACVSAVLGHPVDASVTRAGLPQWDSLKQAEILFAVEDALGVQFTETQLGALDGIPSIIAAAEALSAT